ncbi:conserved hypothetical protein [Pyrenophora tritici-repentis Pt-1C-BFP]|uniref:Uncharacterized protein n=1 Tax=Pyrenophora tritici-repentis (strain Pt-1C-BFP) TaxID=426418 RepID=B2VWI5_PYRTR|nr:uncharacterized protein PTRG_01547 [Pyrenophora tritici-repentis Pt-1C-BFP]EDU40985.1 conserved hypothetical protein [Pyrenophora tritici-repentis Pt-1C-BFP]
MNQQKSTSIHSLKTHNDILNTEDECLRQALALRKKHKKRSKPLDLQQRKEYHSSAVFWSPSKLRKAQIRERVKHQEEEAEKPQKAQKRELKVANTLYKRKMAEEAKALREKVRKKPGQKSAKRRLKPPRGGPKKSKKNEIATLNKLYNNSKEAREQLQSLLKVDRQSGGVIIAFGGGGLLRRNLHRQLHPKRHEHD